MVFILNQGLAHWPQLGVAGKDYVEWYMPSYGLWLDVDIYNLFRYNMLRCGTMWHITYQMKTLKWVVNGNVVILTKFSSMGAPAVVILIWSKWQLPVHSMTKILSKWPHICRRESKTLYFQLTNNTYTSVIPRILQKLSSVLMEPRCTLSGSISISNLCNTRVITELSS